MGAADASAPDAADGVATGRIESVLLPGKPMWCPQARGVRESRQPLRFEEPFTEAGDLLVVRGDLMHMSGPSDGFRLAMSIRMWDHLPTEDELRLGLATAGCATRRSIIKAALAVAAPARGCEAFHMDPRQ